MRKDLLPGWNEARTDCGERRHHRYSPPGNNKIPFLLKLANVNLQRADRFFKGFEEDLQIVRLLVVVHLLRPLNVPVENYTRRHE